MESTSILVTKKPRDMRYLLDHSISRYPRHCAPRHARQFVRPCVTCANEEMVISILAFGDNTPCKSYTCMRYSVWKYYLITLACKIIATSLWTSSTKSIYLWVITQLLCLCLCLICTYM